MTALDLEFEPSELDELRQTLRAARAASDPSGQSDDIEPPIIAGTAIPKAPPKPDKIKFKSVPPPPVPKTFALEGDEERSRRVMEMLLQFTPFKRLETPTMKDMFRRCKLMRFEPGQVVLEAGIGATHFFIVLSGHVQRGGGGLAMSADFLPEGELIGFVPCVNGGRHDQKIMAKERSELVRLSKVSIDALRKQYEDFDELIEDMLEKPAGQNDDIEIDRSALPSPKKRERPMVVAPRPRELEIPRWAFVVGAVGIAALIMGLLVMSYLGG